MINESNCLIAPSLLAADPLRFAEELKSVESAGADWHHVDVMDGHFVPNLTYGIPFVKALKSFASIPLDVHIMVSNPDEVALEYVKAGADYLVFPVESVVHPHRLIQTIHEAGAKAGIAINPGTSLSQAEELLPFVDLINVMSVNPGFGGQSFIPQVVDKIRRLKKQLTDIGSSALIQVDGGINQNTSKEVLEAGAQVLVAGTYVYGADNRSNAIESLRGR
ncbi:MAG: ribulose-phosphate 3-epimerase [Oligoflexus sp.]